MEGEDDVEGVELGAGDGEGEPNEDGVEDNAELEDVDGCHLSGVVFQLVEAFFFAVEGGDGGVLMFGSDRILIIGGGGVLVVDVGARVGEVVFAWGVDGGAGGGAVGGGAFGTGALIVGVRVAKRGEAHGHELDEEQRENGHQNDTFSPIIFRDGSR